MLGLFFSEQTAVCMRICSCCVTVSQAFCYVGDPTCQEKEHSKAQSTQDIHKDDLYVKKKKRHSKEAFALPILPLIIVCRATTCPYNAI